VCFGLNDISIGWNFDIGRPTAIEGPRAGLEGKSHSKVAR
jgi:hypothetical protein